MDLASGVVISVGLEIDYKRAQTDSSIPPGGHTIAALIIIANEQTSFNDNIFYWRRHLYLILYSIPRTDTFTKLILLCY